MDLRQLRYFVAIAESGSISGAAQRLNVAQPALSQHVRNLETELGTHLLIRQPRGVTLTEAGALLESRARLILDEVARTGDDIRNLAATPQGDVRLGLTGTLSSLLSVPLVLLTRDRFPRIRLTIAEAMSGFVMDWLTAGRIDIAVLYRPAGEPGYRSDRLLQEELVVVAPPGDALPDPCHLADLSDRPMILPSPAHGLRQMLDTATATQGIRLNAVSEVDSFANIKELVQRGQGLSILPRHAVEPEAAAGRLRLITFVAPRLWRDVYLVSRAPGRSGHACDAVRALVPGLVRDLVATNRWSGARLTEGD